MSHFIPNVSTISVHFVIYVFLFLVPSILHTFSLFFPSANLTYGGVPSESRGRIPLTEPPHLPSAVHNANINYLARRVQGSSFPRGQSSWVGSCGLTKNRFPLCEKNENNLKLSDLLRVRTHDLRTVQTFENNKITPSATQPCFSNGITYYYCKENKISLL